MLRRSGVLVIGLVLFAAASVQADAAKPAASPMGQIQLRGHWVCTQTGTSGSGTFAQDWAPVFGGTWLRATDSTKGQVTGEHTLTYSKADSTWIVLDAFFIGSYDVLHGTGSGANRITFHAVYPAGVGLSVIYARVTPTQYTADAAGTIRGKKLNVHDVCNKR